MARVYLRINTALGKERAVRNALRKITGVKKADIVTGRHDVIALIEASNPTAALSTVVKRVRRVGGITRTETDLVVE